MQNTAIVGRVQDWMSRGWHRTGRRGWEVAGLVVNWRKVMGGVGYSRRMISEMQRSSYFAPRVVVAMENRISVRGGLL